MLLVYQCHVNKIVLSQCHGMSVSQCHVSMYLLRVFRNVIDFVEDFPYYRSLEEFSTMHSICCPWYSWFCSPFNTSEVISQGSYCDCESHDFAIQGCFCGFSCIYRYACLKCIPYSPLWLSWNIYLCITLICFNNFIFGSVRNFVSISK